MKLSWKLSRELSALHLAWCSDRLDGNSLAFRSHELAAAAKDFASLPSKLGVKATVLWETVFALSPDCPQNRQLAERALRKLQGPAATESDVSLVADYLGGLKNQYASAYPDLENELKLRMQPLQQLWEAYGPGLLAQIGGMTSRDLIVDSAEVCLVQPAIGGFGFAHLATNRIHFEAVLTNALPNLPESLRLAWLLSQLDMERPEYSELINRHRLRRIAGLALIPATLSAGAELSLCSLAEREIALAIQYWQPETLADYAVSAAVPAVNSDTPQPKQGSATGMHAARLAPVILTWWETWLADPNKWSVALTGLDRMIEQFESA